MLSRGNWKKKTSKAERQSYGEGIELTRDVAQAGGWIIRSGVSGIASRMTNSFIEGLLKVPEHISGFRLTNRLAPPSSLRKSRIEPVSSPTLLSLFSQSPLRVVCLRRILRSSVSSLLCLPTIFTSVSQEGRLKFCFLIKWFSWQI